MAAATHADAECGEELGGGAHEVGQVPALQQRRLELERDREHADDDVGHGQVADEVVHCGPHPVWTQMWRLVKNRERSHALLPQQGHAYTESHNEAI